MVRAGTRALVRRWKEQAALLLLLLGMAASHALVLDRLTGVRTPVVAVALAGALVGWALSARALRAGRWLPLAALAAATLTTWLGAAALHPDAGPVDRLLAMRADLLAEAAHIPDMGAISGRTAGPLAVLAVAWTGPLLAARACRLRRPPIHAWGPMLGVLLAGLAVAATEDIAPLVAFSAGAMLLSIAMKTDAMRGRWERRGIHPGAGVTGSMTRHGWAATAATVTLAWALTSVAVGAPLEAAWRQVGGWWSEQGPGGIGGGPAATFGDSFQISDAFNPSRDVVARVNGARTAVYLRAVTHDSYTGRGWTQSVGRTRSVAPGAPLLDVFSLELPLAGSLPPPVEVEVLMERGGSVLLLPGQPLSLSIQASVSESAAGPFLVAAAPEKRLQPGQAYSVLSTVRHASGTALSSAPAADPAQLAPYLALDNVSVRTRREAARVTAGAATAYAKAVALMRYLRGEGFDYEPRASRPAPGSGQDAVDFFLFDETGRVGFCEQFASAMVVMARSVGIPARLARGYAGGERLVGDTYRIRGTQAHAWAELFFPGYGWQVFEATPSVRSVARPGGLEPGASPVAPQPPSAGPEASEPPLAEGEPPGGRETDNDPWLRTAAIAIAAGTLVTILVLASWWCNARFRQGLRRPARSPAWLWARLTRDATRAGIVPAPTQTPYEFARAVEHVLPEIGPDIGLLAAAYVSEAYAGPRRPARQVGGDVSDAWRRVVGRLRRARVAQLVRRGARR